MQLCRYLFIDFYGLVRARILRKYDPLLHISIISIEVDYVYFLPAGIKIC